MAFRITIVLAYLWSCWFELSLSQITAQQPSTVDIGPLFVSNQIFGSGQEIQYNGTNATRGFPVNWLGNATAPYSVTLWDTPSYTSSSSSSVYSGIPIPPGYQSPNDRMVQTVAANTTNNTVNWTPALPPNTTYGSGYYYLRVVDSKGYYNNTSTFLIENESPSAYTYSSGTGGSSDSDSLSSGDIAGVVIGCLAAVGLIVAGWWFWRRRRRAKKGREGRPGLPPRPGTKEYEKPELPADNMPFWKRIFHREKHADPVEMAAADEAAIRSELPGDAPKPVELPTEANGSQKEPEKPS